MNILFLSQIVPYPPHGGVLQRGYNVIREIAKFNKVHLLAFVHPDVLSSESQIDESRSVLGEFCETVAYFPLWPKQSSLHKYLGLLVGIGYPLPFSALAHSSGAYARQMEAIISQFPIDVVHYDTIGLARYRDRHSDIPAVLTHHNIESQLMERRSNVEEGRIRRGYVAMQARKLRNYEISESPKFDVNIVMSQHDELELKKLAPSAQTAIVPNGVDVDYFRPMEVGAEEALVYTGGMNMFANLDAVMHFCNEIWPVVKQTVPNVRFYVIGQDPPPELLRKSDKDSSIIVTGYVDDVRPYVARSAVYVVPIRVGGGTRLKVLDAMAQGKAIVSTSVGCEGIEVTNGENIYVEDSVEKFAQRTIELLRNEAQRKQLGAAARRLAEVRYSWTGIGQVLHGVYQQVATR